MPIPLGVLAVAGAGAGPAPSPVANAYEWLETQVLGSNQATVTFSNLNSTYGSTYQHLQLRVVVRTDRVVANDSDFCYIYFNADETASNYYVHVLSGDGSTVQSDSSQHAFLTYIRASNVANAYAAYVADILDPFETSKFKTTRVLLGQGGADRNIVLQSHLWRNTNAVDSIKLDAIGNFTTGSRFSLYGLKG